MYTNQYHFAVQLFLLENIFKNKTREQMVLYNDNVTKT